jgi:hypothetical protein
VAAKEKTLFMQTVVVNKKTTTNIDIFIVMINSITIEFLKISVIIFVSDGIQTLPLGAFEKGEVIASRKKQNNRDGTHEKDYTRTHV